MHLYFVVLRAFVGGNNVMTPTAVASCPCIPEYVFCTWSGCRNKL